MTSKAALSASAEGKSCAFELLRSMNGISNVSSNTITTTTASVSNLVQSRSIPNLAKLSTKSIPSSKSFSNGFTRHQNFSARYERDGTEPLHVPMKRSYSSRSYKSYGRSPASKFSSKFLRGGSANRPTSLELEALLLDDALSGELPSPKNCHHHDDQCSSLNCGGGGGGRTPTKSSASTKWKIGGTHNTRVCISLPNSPLHTPPQSSPPSPLLPPKNAHPPCEERRTSAGAGAVSGGVKKMLTRSKTSSSIAAGREILVDVEFARDLTRRQKNASTSSTVADGSETDEDRQVDRNVLSNSCKRVYILEGPVKMTMGVSTRDRYLFMFNDILLIAKVKSASTFKLKTRVRMSELWLSNCVDDIGESNQPPDRSFVIGWPTVNLVVTFNTVEERKLWSDSLLKYTNEQYSMEETISCLVNVCYRSSEDICVCSHSLSVTPKCDARSVINKSLPQFQLENEDVNEFQLWTVDKEGSCPLLGHELPFSIRTAQLQDSTVFDSSDVELVTSSCQCDASKQPLGDAVSGYVSHDQTRCQFFLKRGKRIGLRGNLELQRKWMKKPAKMPILNWAMHKKPGTSAQAQKSGAGAQDSAPTGELYGRPLTELATDGQPIPGPIQDILEQLFRKGPGTTGIFRKSALHRTVKDIHQALDQGKEVDFSERTSLMCATVLKDFFRSLPESVILPELYPELVQTKTIENVEERAAELTRILERLPPPNMALTTRFLCLLYHVQRFSSTNNMNAYNLAVCIAPSIMSSSMTLTMSQQEASDTADVISFLVEHFLLCFGSANEYLLGQEGDIVLDGAAMEDDSDSGTDVGVGGDNGGTDVWDSIDQPSVEMFEVSPSIHGSALESAFYTYSDSSLNTNDSDHERLLSTSSALSTSYNEAKSSHLSPKSPDRALSRSTPVTPNAKRKVYAKRPSVNSNDSDSDGADITDARTANFKRRLLRQSNTRRVLTSTTTSAELIRHDDSKSLADDPKTLVSSSSEERAEERMDAKAGNDVTDSYTESSQRLSVVARKQMITSPPEIKYFGPDSCSVVDSSGVTSSELCEIERVQPIAPPPDSDIARTSDVHMDRSHRPSVTRRAPVPLRLTAHRDSVDNYTPLDVICPPSPSTIVKPSAYGRRYQSNVSELRDDFPSHQARKRSLSAERAVPLDTHSRQMTIDVVPCNDVSVKVACRPVERPSPRRVEQIDVKDGAATWVPVLPPLTAQRTFEPLPLNSNALISGPLSTLLIASSPTSETSVEPLPSIDSSPAGTDASPTGSNTDVHSPPGRRHVDEGFIETSETYMQDAVNGDGQLSRTKSNESLNSLESEHSNSSCSNDSGVSPSNSFRTDSPFVLKLSGDQSSAKSETRDQSVVKQDQSKLEVEKKLLMKLPSKMDLLSKSEQAMESRRFMTGKELRRSNRKLQMEIRNALKEGKFNNSTIQNRNKHSNDASNARIHELENVTNDGSIRQCDALITLRTIVDRKSERRRPSGQVFELNASNPTTLDDLDSTINALDKFDEDDLLRITKELSHSNENLLHSNEVGYSSEEPDGNWVTPVERLTPVDSLLVNANTDVVFGSSSVDESCV